MIQVSKLELQSLGAKQKVRHFRPTCHATSTDWSFVVWALQAPSPMFVVRVSGPLSRIEVGFRSGCLQHDPARALGICFQSLVLRTSEWSSLYGGLLFLWVLYCICCAVSIVGHVLLAEEVMTCYGYQLVPLVPQVAGLLLCLPSRDRSKFCP